VPADKLSHLLGAHRYSVLCFTSLYGALHVYKTHALPFTLLLTVHDHVPTLPVAWLKLNSIDSVCSCTLYIHAGTQVWLSGLSLDYAVV